MSLSGAILALQQGIQFQLINNTLKPSSKTHIISNQLTTGKTTGAAKLATKSVGYYYVGGEELSKWKR